MGRRLIWPPPLRRHKASGLAYVRVGDKNRYFGPHGEPATRAAYEAWAASLPARPAVAVAPREKSVAEVVNAWAEEALPGHTAGEQEGYQAALKVLVRVAGRVPASAFSVEDLEGVRDAMVTGSWRTAEEKRKRPARNGRPPVTPGTWNRTTVNRRVSRLLTVWRWCERKKLVPRGSWAGLRALPKLGPKDRAVRGPGKRRTFSDGEVIRAALAVKRGPVRIMLLLQLWSGMRSGEVRMMRWSEIDRAGEAWTYSPAQHKNAWRGQSRNVVLGKRCQALLRLARRMTPRGDLVFVCKGRGGAPDHPYTKQSYGLIVRRAARRAGLAGLRAYDARHTARQRITRLYGLDYARSFLGQKSIGQANDYGDSLDLEMAAKAAKRAG